MRRASLIVAIAFGASTLAALGLFVVYIAGGQPQLEGALLFVALTGIGAGLMVWATGLMTGIGQITQPRRRAPPPPEEKEAAAEAMAGGVEEMSRRRLLFGLLLGAAGALGLAAIFPIRSLGRAPGASLFRTEWRTGLRLVDVDGNLVTRDTLEVDSFTTVFPEDAVGSGDSQAVLIRVPTGSLDLPPDRLAGAPDGYVAYSKICTHAGCAVGLYLAEVQQLRCPCHQSTFDVLNGAQPVYGPAARALPQLPIQIDPDGTMRALGDFTAPVGPSFWDLPP
ncbi:MAG TPA: Rieske (2Fe-2S) protein [Actinomycetota bacterium]